MQTDVRSCAHASVWSPAAAPRLQSQLVEGASVACVGGCGRLESRTHMLTMQHHSCPVATLSLPTLGPASVQEHDAVVAASVWPQCVVL